MVSKIFLQTGLRPSVLFRWSTFDQLFAFHSIVNDVDERNAAQEVALNARGA